MASPWCRLWADMPNDPKWRTIAKVSKQTIGNVLAVYIHMMVCASNATERGRTQGWKDEDVATALDLEIEQIVAIREAMQGRVLDGDNLAGWGKRQPIREDESASSRAKAWRDKQSAGKSNAQRTQPNATEREVTTEVEVEVEVEVEIDIEVDKSKASVTEIASDTHAKNAELISFAMNETGVMVKSADLRILALAKQGILPDTAIAACEEAKRAKPNEPIHAGYVFKILERWAADAGLMNVSGAVSPRKFDPVSYVNRNRR